MDRCSRRASGYRRRSAFTPSRYTSRRTSSSELGGNVPSTAFSLERTNQTNGFGGTRRREEEKDLELLIFSSSCSLLSHQGRGGSRVPKPFGRRLKPSGLEPKRSGLEPGPLGLGPKPSGLEPRPLGLGPKPSGPELRPLGLGRRPSGLDLRPLGLGPKPSGPELRPLGLGPKPSGLDLRPLGLGPKSSGLKLRPSRHSVADRARRHQAVLEREG